MRVLRGYFARQTLGAVVFVLAGFLALFSFFDFIAELEDIGRGRYEFQHALAYVLLSIPNHIYELMPVATLIGAIYALAQFASNSEFTAMRAAGLSRRKAMAALLRVGVILSVATALIGEVLAPPAEQLAQDIRLGALGGQITGQFRSGIWIRDTVRDDNDRTIANRFVNIGQLSPTGKLRDVRIFEFDTDLRLRSVLWSPSGAFSGVEQWDLNEVSELLIRAGAGKPAETVADTAASGNGVAIAGMPADAAMPFDTIRVERLEPRDRSWSSELTPELLAVMAIAPDRMAVWNLLSYVSHLKDNKQDSSRYELALWKKAAYPLAILVMLALALPFAYLHARAGSIGYKVFAGIMLGVAFHFLNGLFSHLGLLNTWPPWISVSIPSIVALIIALFMLFRVGGAR